MAGIPALIYYGALLAIGVLPDRFTFPHEIGE